MVHSLFTGLLDATQVRLAAFGSEYVRLVTGACMAETDSHVVLVYFTKDKIKCPIENPIPIYEPGLDNYIKCIVEVGRLEFVVGYEQIDGNPAIPSSNKARAFIQWRSDH